MLRIERLGAGGDGVAGDGTFVARTLPGEVVEGEAVEERLDAPRIITPSPDRVAPPCPHFKRCGGCALQHASDPFVAAWKAERVRAALAQRGLDAEVAGTATSPPASRRRAALTGRRTKKGAVVGFHVRRSEEVVAIPGCTLLLPQIVERLPVLEAVARLAATRGGTVGLHVTWSDPGLDLVVTDAKPATPDLLGEVAALDLARVTWNGEPLLLARAPSRRMGAATVTPPPGAFLQATDHGEAALLAAVRRAVGGASRIADLFAGCGTFALPLASAAHVDAYDGDRALVAALRDGAATAPTLKPVTATARDLFRDPLTEAELTPYDAVVIDPPRAGAQAQIARLAASGVPTIAHVSCNPATFARDAGALVDAGYRMGPIAVVDQFRWSPHVELVAAFTR
ncbi:class I SAM-dependent RNA methyltransferase [Jannaschia sp. Os4]|uniref:class I SAM-dependent RNA methyltransferase n=1 Tax=Jannaschia sp. Os4 TaxID=2807617 RepID=UPI00193A2B14|nr:class I SAM-dependent RNA methyltransferase [Jannaschia sp. Os4]MBM2575399.1 class I SAM-dependent RNA methyltransferase [Jannaschia sp. Os4]